MACFWSKTAKLDRCAAPNRLQQSRRFAHFLSRCCQKYPICLFFEQSLKYGDGIKRLRQPPPPRSEIHFFAMADVQFSIPDSVRSRIAEMADREGLTIEQFVAVAVTERVFRLTDVDAMRQGVSAASEQEFRSYLDLVPNGPVVASDYHRHCERIEPGFPSAQNPKCQSTGIGSFKSSSLQNSCQAATHR